MYTQEKVYGYIFRWSVLMFGVGVVMGYVSH